MCPFAFMELSQFHLIASTHWASPAYLLYVKLGFEYQTEVNNPIPNFITWQSDIDLMVQLGETVVGLDQI